MVRVLVTGGSGFIGRHLVDILLQRGNIVRVLDLAPAETIGVEHLQGSVADGAIVDQAVTDVDIVYHLAGIPHLWRDDKADFDRANHQGARTVLVASAKRGVRRVVHCSTESILLPRQRSGASIDESANPTIEDMPGPYTRSKFLGERAALAAAREGLDVVVVNPTVPLGAGDRNMTPPAAMLELFLSGGSPFFLDCMLNFVDVRDVAQGIARAGDQGRRGERYILGGENVGIRELLPILERKAGKKMPKRAVPVWVAQLTGAAAESIADRVTHKPPVATREGVALALRSAPFDSGKARRELGYAPSPIDRALTEAVEAFKRRV